MVFGLGAEHSEKNREREREFRRTDEEVAAPWKWLINANGIRECGFDKELKREGDSVKALERLFAKMNKRAAMRQKKLSSGKGHRTR